jgi:hypothetical protein
MVHLHISYHKKLFALYRTNKVKKHDKEELEFMFKHTAGSLGRRPVLIPRTNTITLIRTVQIGSVKTFVALQANTGISFLGTASFIHTIPVII